MTNAEKAGNFVNSKIELLARYGADHPVVRSTLAKLRRGIGKRPGSTPELWEITLKDMPEELMPQSELAEREPTRGEWAIHTALTLFALHQQGKDLEKQCMNQKGNNLGASVNKLIHNPDDEERIKRRFNAAATADSLSEFSHHLRGLIQLCKADNIPIDYPKLTEDLYRFQSQESRERDSVRLRWGQDFYYRKEKSDNEKK